jgi:hypothetical protein
MTTRPKRLREIFEGLRPHLSACNVDVSALEKPAARLLVIEDFGTRGLTGDPASLDDDNFDRFFRQHGISGKGGKYGGRWGLGKLVYSSSSDVRAFFGLTFRQGDREPLLLGQSVLDIHKLPDGKRYPPHGFWFDTRGDEGLQLPIKDQRLVAEFVRLTGISRTGQSGLSIVIPYVHQEVTEETIIAGVVRNYYFPILAGKLTVEVGTHAIDQKTFHTVAASVANISNIPLDFVEAVSRQLASPPAYAGISGIDGRGVADKCFASEQLAAMKFAFGKGELLHVRLPVQLKKKQGANPIGSIDLFMKQLPENGKPFALFARGSITVPGEIRYFSGAHAYGAMVASEANIVEFLGDAENPAHTGWNSTAEKLGKNWRSPAATLKHVRYALRDLYNLVSDRVEQEDRDALVDFFSLLDQTQSSKGKKKRTPKVPPNLPAREKALLIRARAGGFLLVPGLGASKWTFPKIVDIRVAYDLTGGDPFKRHSTFDFDLTKDEVNVSAENADVTALRPNKLRLTVKSPEFKLEASGFDLNRDIIVDARTV